MSDKSVKPFNTTSHSKSPATANQFTATFRRFQDAIIFLLVWFWVIVKYPMQYIRYLLRSFPKKTLPHPVRPRCANDKFFWRKVFDHDPRFVTVSDKLAVKDWIREHGFGLKTAKVFWSGQDAHDIPDGVLDGDVVLKANHGWKMNLFVHEGKYDRDQMIKTANGFLERDHGRYAAEWGYYDIPRKLFVEEMLGDKDSQLTELKYYTYGKKIERLVVIYDRFTDISADIWAPDEDGELHLTEEISAVSEKRPGLPLPPTHEHATDIARDIGSHFDHMRVDLFTNGKEVWLSELTVYNLSGYISNFGQDPDSPMNTSWDLRRSWFLSTEQQGWRRIYAQALQRALAWKRKANSAREDTRD